MKRRLLGFILTVSMLVSALSPVAYAEVLSEDNQDVVFDDELSEENIDDMYEMAHSLGDMVAGVNYVEDEFIFFADTRAEAEDIAAAYDADLISYNYTVAVAKINIEETGDLQSVLLAGAAQDLPTIYPNEIFHMENDGLSVDDGDAISVEAQTDREPLLAGSLKYSDDPYSSAQYYHYYVDDYKLWDMGITGKDIVVAVVDTGVNVDHPDLRDNITEFRYNATAEYDEDGNELPVDHSYIHDGHGHGSHVAGLVAAKRDNGIGGCGVAPDAKIMPIKVFNDSGNGDTACVAEGIMAAVENGADIINLSLGAFTASPVEMKAVMKAIDAGAIVVTAAGNEATDIYEYPACYHPDCISVAALAPGSDEERNAEIIEFEEGVDAGIDYVKGYDLSLPVRAAYFTNYQDMVKAAVPGTSMLSTGPSLEAPYIFKGGTSQATPVVAGIIALLKSYDNSLTREDMIEILKRSNDGVVYYSTYYEMKGSEDIRVKCGATNALAAFNTLTGAYDDITLKEPVIVAPSKNKRGSYISGENQYLTIENPNMQGVRVYYTDNGADPRKKGTVYSEPIALDFSGKKTFKAVAEFDGRFSKVVTLKGDFDDFAVDGLVVSTDTGFYTRADWDFAVVINASGYGAYSYDNQLKYIPIGNTKAAVKLFSCDRYGGDISDWVSFSSTDTSVITVDSKGVVKPAKSAKVGEEAKIIISALDGSDQKCEFTFRVFETIKSFDFVIESDNKREYLGNKLNLKWMKGGFKIGEYIDEVYDNIDALYYGWSVATDNKYSCYLDDEALAEACSLYMLYSSKELTQDLELGSLYFDINGTIFCAKKNRATIKAISRDGGRAALTINYKAVKDFSKLKHKKFKGKPNLY